MSELKRVIISIFSFSLFSYFLTHKKIYIYTYIHKNAFYSFVISSLTVKFKQYTKSLRQPTTRDRPHTTGDENNSPFRVKEASIRPSRPSRIHTVPSVEASPTRVPLLPTAEPSNTQGLEKTFPVVRKLHTREPSAPFRQYKQPSCDPHRTCPAVTHGDEKTGPFVRNSHICMEAQIEKCWRILEKLPDFLNRNIPCQVFEQLIVKALLLVG